MFPLDQKTILVTGSSKGIGAEIVRVLGERGAYVIAHYGNDRAGAEEATAAIPADRKLLISADLGVPRAMNAFWDEACAWRGRVDVLINNAAVFINDGGIEEDEESWDRVWDLTMRVNVLSPARLIRRAVHHFRDHGGGIVISVSSWSAQRGSTSPKTIAYAASKAAIRAATQTVARAYAQDNVLAYIIAPGVVRTRMSLDSAAVLGGEEKVTAGLTMGEWVTPEEIGRLAAFLASGQCRHLTGATLDVNGASYVR